MDLRVYVDGIARIICDLTSTTTVHEIIIALAQYKGKTGRYALIERAPDGTQRTLSPNELATELTYHPDWSYILRENVEYLTNQKRSKSLDERKTSRLQYQQSIVEIPSAVTSSLSSSSTSGQFRTVHHHLLPSTFATLSSSSSSSVKSSPKKKHPHVQQIFSSINTNNNNNNHCQFNDETIPTAFLIEQKRSSRTPIQIVEQDFGIIDNHRRSRPVSAIDHSAFQLVHPNVQQQQQYVTLLKILKSQELQVERQKRELTDKQKEIDYREKTLHHNEIEKEFQFLTEHDRRLTSDCQHYSEEYLTNELDKEFEYKKKLNYNYEHLQQQLARCSTTLEQKQQLQDQMQLNIEQIQRDIEQSKINLNNEKKDINQCQQDFESSTISLTQQEDLVRKLTERNEDFERNLQQRRQQITDLENELIKLDQILMQNLANSSYRFSSIPHHYKSLPSTSTTTDVLMPGRLEFVNSTLWKLCPSGIWV